VNCISPPLRAAQLPNDLNRFACWNRSVPRRVSAMRCALGRRTRRSTYHRP
jgi:hypothetical protein